MHRLNALLGLPQQRFASIHVVGTNGKSSVARMTAALLEAHRVRAAACVSPHTTRWSQRILIGGEEIAPDAFAAAVERAAEAAAAVNRTLPEGEAVTQFELATAASFVALAAAGVEAAAIEAGLGGRLDATNTIPSRATVLTSVGLDHTEWLGETKEQIAAEKLAVLRDRTTLVLGRVSPAVRTLAEAAARERGAKLVLAPEDPGPDVHLRVAGGFQRRNFALACAAAEAFLGGLDRERVAAVAAAVEVPGRLERIAEDPPTYLDAAHNPQAAAALAEALMEIGAPPASGRAFPRIPGKSATSSGPVVACLAVLADKDARGIVAALAPALARVVCAELPPRAVGGEELPRRGLGAEELAEICAGAGVVAEADADLARAVTRTRELAAAAGGVALVAGSHYALEPARRALDG